MTPLSPLYHLIFGNRACFKGGGGGNTTSTTTTSTIPEFAEPYYHEMMARAEAVSQQPYQPYGGQRISDFSGDQRAAQQGTRSMVEYGAPGLLGAQQYANLATAGALNSQYMPNQFSAMMTNPNDPRADIRTRIFSPEVRDYYMSPYMDSVVDRAQEDAILQHQRQQIARNDAAVKAGAFGGDRRFVGDYLAEEGLEDRLSDIYAQGQQSSFENAQQQFERDRAARLQADIASAGMWSDVTGMNAQQWLEAQRLNEQSRQFGFGSGLEGIRTGLQGAQTMGQLGPADQQAWLQRLSALSGVGAEQQALEQAALDQSYQDFVNQRDYERNQLSWLSGIMSGVPVSPNQDTVVTEPAPSLISQLSGLGIAGLGLYNAMS